ALVLPKQPKQQVFTRNLPRAELACFVTAEEQHAPGRLGVSLEHGRLIPSLVPGRVDSQCLVAIAPRGSRLPMNNPAVAALAVGTIDTFHASRPRAASSARPARGPDCCGRQLARYRETRRNRAAARTTGHHAARYPRAERRPRLPVSQPRVQAGAGTQSG